MAERTILDIQRETMAAIDEMNEASRLLLEQIEKDPTCPRAEELLARWKEKTLRVLDLGHEAELLGRKPGPVAGRGG